MESKCKGAVWCAMSVHVKVPQVVEIILEGFFLSSVMVQALAVVQVSADM